MVHTKKFFVSVVIPVYNESGNIEPLLTALLKVLSDYTYEVIFVDDGSTDNTPEIIKEHSHKNHRIKLVSFVRNFGHQMALTAGYHFASGDCVITLDADMQDPPELIPKMIEKWAGGTKIVYAKREEREEPFFKKATAHLFYRLINTLSDTPIPEDIGDYRLLDRQVVTFLNTLTEKSRFLRGLVSWGGFSSDFVTFKRTPRMHGKTHYPLSKMVNFALDGIISFSSKPLKFASYLGFFTAFFGFLGGLYALYIRLFLPHEYWVTGWTALFVAIMFFGGFQLMTIGIIGEYIGKIYKEIQARPQYIIGEKVNL